MSDEQAVAWLRQQIEGDKAAAEVATPGPWEFEGDDPTDDELYSVHDGEHGDLIGQTVAWTRDRQVANGQHMARHDPQDVIADCEAKLAILDAHGVDYTGEYGQAIPGECLTCITNRDPYPESWEGDTWPCPTLQLLARACRHREGYAEHWGVSTPAASS